MCVCMYVYKQITLNLLYIVGIGMFSASVGVYGTIGVDVLNLYVGWKNLD